MVNPHPSEDSPEIGPRRVVYENKYQRVCSVDLNFGTHSKEIFVNEHGTRSGVLFVRDEEVLLVRQYRLLPDELSWEIPGGRIDEGETPETGGIREALEETAIRAHSLHPLVYFIPGLDTCDNPTHVFWCNDFATTSGSANHDPHEINGMQWIPFTHCIDMIFERRILDSMTITALLAWQALQTRNNPVELSEHS